MCLHFLKDVSRVNKTARASLVSRFLQSIPSKQLIKDHLAKRNDRISCLFVKNVKRFDLLDQSSITKQINDEISKNTRISVTSPSLNPKLKLLVSSINESIYKVSSNRIVRFYNFFADLRIRTNISTYLHLRRYFKC